MTGNTEKTNTAKTVPVAGIAGYRTGSTILFFSKCRPPAFCDSHHAIAHVRVPRQPVTRTAPTRVLSSRSQPARFSANFLRAARFAYHHTNKNVGTFTHSHGRARTNRKAPSCSP